MLLLKERICPQSEQILSYDSNIHLGSYKVFALRAAYMVKK